MKNVIGLLNLYDSPNLGPLTENRTLASTSFLGRFAIMDFALSNFTNSGIDDFSILVKNNFRSVTKHVHTMKAWVSNTKIGKQYLLLNEAGIKNHDLNNDINNMKTNDWVFYEKPFDYYAIQPAHVIAQIDFKKVLDKHIETNADITLVYTEIDNGMSSFGEHFVAEIDENDLVTFMKKNDGSKRKVKVSLESYIFSKDVMKKIIYARGENRALSLRAAVMRAVNDRQFKVVAYKQEGYVRSFDSFKRFCDISFELLDFKYASMLFDNDWTCYTNTHNTPPALYGKEANIKNSYIANGAEINGTVENSIISRNVKVGKGAVVRNSIILTGTKIEDCAIIENAVIDKYSMICQNASVKGAKSNPTYIRQGKTVK